jgi:3-hydroxyisobutyrate dehydrogenase
MKKIGFIGLGVMGAPMASNLLSKGYALKVYNRTAEKADALAKLGAEVAESPADAARHGDVVITMVSDDDAIRDVYYGEQGVINAVRPGTTVIDCSTISPALSVKLAGDIQSRSAHFLDAPVTGSKPGAVNGTLLFMVGGDSRIIDQHRDVLLAMGKEIIHTGANGSGSTAKLAHNTMVAINLAGLAEGISIAAKGGIDPSVFLKIVQAGNAASKVAELKSEKILSGDYSVQFALGLMLKDLKLASGLTDRMGLSSPMLGTVKNLFQMGQTAGLGDSDLSALMRLYENWIGQRVSK